MSIMFHVALQRPLLSEYSGGNADGQVSSLHQALLLVRAPYIPCHNPNNATQSFWALRDAPFNAL